LEPVPVPMTQQKKKPRYDTEIESDEEMIPVCGDKSMLRKIHLNQRGLRPTHTYILFDADV
jgi:transposase